ncbi:hypothetical protein [Stieleria mannarensis]|uniref:hypothetical protein n=1 Tax=Stieleria mannarensis TaxID=2755585 RepID=UPI0016023F62|nr:hypothetical protein [Rhodopirellula sp. JC639]
MCTVLSLFLVATVVAIKGNVSGTEFAPSHFQTRQFSFYEIPFLHLQITPITRRDSTGPLARQIRAKGWITVVRGKKPSGWHLVSLRRGPTSTPAVAGLLTDTMQLQDSGSPFWVSWNNDHPNRASVLWPTVQRLAERELYVMLPELFQLARTLPGQDNAAELTAAVDRWLVDQYVMLVNDLRDADRADLADDLLAEARRDYPASQQLADLDSRGG